MTPPVVAESEVAAPPARAAEPMTAANATAPQDAPGRTGVPMGRLPDRARAVVLAIEADDDFQRPLLDLGLTPGTEVLVVRRAPLRDPIEVYVRGSHFSIRREEANRILVEAV